MADPRERAQQLLRLASQATTPGEKSAASVALSKHLAQHPELLETAQERFHTPRAPAPRPPVRTPPSMPKNPVLSGTDIVARLMIWILVAYFLWAWLME